MASYHLSTKSQRMLDGVKPELVSVVHRAIELTAVDFKVGEGLRSKERQFMLIAQGKSRTKNSKHLTGDAVDLWACPEGSVSWDWVHYYKIASAMRAAAQELGTRIKWGGVWDRALNDLEGELSDEVEAYRVRHAGADFIDGPHFELCD